MPQAPPAGLRRVPLDQVIQEEATALGIRPDLALQIAQRESALRPDAISPKGAQGVMQLMPGTARDLGVNAADPLENIRGGLRYFKQQLDKHGGDERLALAAYNAGPGAVAKAGGVPNFPETRQYVQAITGAAPPPPQTPAAPPVDLSSLRKVTAAPPPAPAPTPQPSHRRTTPFDQKPRPMGLRETFDPLIVGMDPRTPGGLRNLGGLAGSVALTAATSGTSLAAQGFLHGARTLGLAALGAGAGGAVAEGVNIARETPTPGQPPPSPSDLALRMAKGGGEQAAYEVAGGALAAPVKAIGRRMIAPRVNRAAAQALDAQLAKAHEALQTTKIAGQEARATAAERTTEQVYNARVAATDALRGTKDRVTSELEALKGVFGQTPRLTSSREAGERAVGVLEGPAKTALDEVGETVRATAETGPALSTASLKAALGAMAEQRTPTTRLKPPDPTVAAMLAQEFTDPKQIAQQQAVREMAGADHPLPGLLGELQKLPETISFADAHRFKRLLDEAVNWDSPAKKSLEQMTKGVRTTLRDLMSTHAPYNAATAEYERLLPLYRKGIADDVKRGIVDNPDSLVKLIKGDQPTNLQRWKELLLQQSAKGGDPALGEQAWQATRAAWTYDKLVKGGLDKLGARLDKLDPDFVRTMYGDAAGQPILDNLRAISGAYQTALARGTADIVDTKAAGVASVRATQFAGQQAQKQVRHQTAQDLYAATAQTKGAREARQTFRQSSVGKVRNLETQGADIAKAIFLGPGTTWGNVAILHLLRGPKAAELVRYAAFSPKVTQLVVDALTGPQPGIAAAALLRIPGMSRLLMGPDLSLRSSHGPPPAPGADTVGGSQPLLGAPPPSPPVRPTEGGGGAVPPPPGPAPTPPPDIPGDTPLKQSLRRGLEGGTDALLSAIGLKEQAPGDLATGVGALASALPLGMTGKGIRGLFSRVDKVVEALPGAVHASKLRSLLGSGASAEEVAYRGLPEFFAQAGERKIPKAEIEDWLRTHPAPEVGVAQLGKGRSQPYQVTVGREVIWRGDNEAQARGIAREHGGTASLTASQPVGYQPTKYQQYQVPGGEAYTENLLTLQPTARLNILDAKLKREGKLPPAEATEYNRLTEVENLPRSSSAAFTKGHYGDVAPNVLAHSRANERTLPGVGKGLFLEEVQSDWHQKGKKSGYAQAQTPLTRDDVEMRRMEGGDISTPYWESYDRRTGQLITRHPGEYPEYYAREEALRIEPRQSKGVPDAPFKESWPDLVLKQRLLEAAERPDLDWVGFTSGATQAKRYDLSQHISELHYSGTNLKAYGKDGEEVISRTGVRPEDLPDLIGKEATEKLLAQPKEGTLQSLRGLELQVGGKGMRQKYDVELRRKLEKLVKPFGGTVEAAPITPASKEYAGSRYRYRNPDGTLVPEGERPRAGARREDNPEYARDVPGESGWIVRLTPQMKAAILKSGLPLMAVGGLMVGQPPPPPASDRRRAAPPPSPPPRR